MKSVFGTTRIMVPALAAALFIAGCAKTPPIVEPAPPPAAAAEHKEENRQDDAKKIVVAKANGVELHMDALVGMMNRLAPGEGATPESVEEHKKMALDKLILQELAYQQAKTKGLSIGADKIDMAINNLKENMGGEKQYAEYLAKAKVTEADLRAQVERSLLIELIYAREVLAVVSVPEDMVRQEYEKVKDRYIVPEKASIVDVFVLKTEDKASKNKARELLKKIKADADKDPWKLVLDGTFIVRDIDVNRNKEMELFDAAKKLKPNQLSGVIETPRGSHIIKLSMYSPERQLTFEEVKGQVELKFKVPAQEKRTEEWEQELKKDAKIEILLDAADKQAPKAP